MSLIRPDGKLLGGLGFEYRAFGALPADVAREMAMVYVQSMVAWNGLIIPQLRYSVVQVHESENPEALQALLAKLKA